MFKITGECCAVLCLHITKRRKILPVDPNSIHTPLVFSVTKHVICSFLCMKNKAFFRTFWSCVKGPINQHKQGIRELF